MSHKKRTLRKRVRKCSIGILMDLERKEQYYKRSKNCQIVKIMKKKL